MGLRNSYNNVKGFLGRNAKILVGGLVLAGAAGTAYLLHNRVKDITEQVSAYSQVYRESGRTSLEHDVECADVKGRLIDINKSWKKPNEVDYVQVRLDKDKTYVCRASNPHANPQEKVLWSKFMQLIDAERKEYDHTLSGYQFNLHTGEVRFSLEDYGKYRLQLGVSTYDNRGRKWQTPEMRTLELLVSKPQEKKKTGGNGKKNGNGNKDNDKQVSPPVVKTPQPDAQVREQEEGSDLPEVNVW